MPQNIFAIADDAWKTGNDKVNAFRKQRADTEAAPLIAAGDTRGAARAYGAAGMADEARTMQRDGQAQQQQSYERGRETAKDDRQSRLDSEAAHEKAARALIDAADELDKIPMSANPNDPDPDRARREALRHPIFQALGITPEMIASIKPGDLSPQALAQFKEKVKLQIVNRGSGGYDVVNTETGKAVSSVEPTKPTILKQGETLLGDDNRPVYTAPKTFAPPRPRATASGGSDNSGALAAIEAELRRRGKLK